MERYVARQMWQLLEPLHAVVYFEPEAKAIYGSAGLKGYWMGYFASRSAALGAVGPQVVTATFYNFHPDMVRRAIPDAWSLSTPEDVLEARYRVAHTALERLLGQSLRSGDVTQAAAIARNVASRCTTPGRPLYAAHSALSWPSEPHLMLWHAATLWREFRGDGHVAALVAHEIDGCEAHVLADAAGLLPEGHREYRGWSDQEWADGAGRLYEKDLLDRDGALTQHGLALRQEIEDLTDDLSLAPLAAVGDDDIATLRLLLQPLVTRIIQREGVPYPNAMGLPKAGSATPAEC